MRQNDVSVIILTKNAGDGFGETLRAVYAQEYAGKFEVIIIDSGSIDETIRIGRSYSSKLISIKPEEFGYGKTRNLGAKLASGEWLVFLSADAIPASNRWLTCLVRNFDDPCVAGIYGRQIPKQDINPMEYFFLSQHYPCYRIVRWVKENKTDIDTIFFSNVNSAIRRRIWEKYPFKDDIIGAEDMEWARRVLIAGYKAVYEPEAAVYHSHNFSLRTVFRRYFRRGASFGQFASNEYASSKFIAKGLTYVKQEMQFLVSNGYTKWLPYAVLYDLAKLLGLSLGKRERLLPSAVKGRLGMNRHYWQK